MDDIQRAIEILKTNKPTSDPRLCGKELCDACDVAISAMRELQRYRQIGTPEECREAREKRRAGEPERRIDWEQEAKKYCASAGELRILLAERLEEIRCRKASLRGLAGVAKDAMDEAVLSWKLKQLEEQEAWLENVLYGKGGVIG